MAAVFQSEEAKLGASQRRVIKLLLFFILHSSLFTLHFFGLEHVEGLAKLLIICPAFRATLHVLAQLGLSLHVYVLVEKVGNLFLEFIALHNLFPFNRC